MTLRPVTPGIRRWSTSRGRTMAEAGGGERILTGVFDTEALAAFREKFPAWRDADEFVLK